MDSSIASDIPKAKSVAKEDLGAVVSRLRLEEGEASDSNPEAGPSGQGAPGMPLVTRRYMIPSITGEEDMPQGPEQPITAAQALAGPTISADPNLVRFFLFWGGVPAYQVRCRLHCLSPYWHSCQAQPG